MNYIGTDIHISTLDFKVVSNLGKVKMARKVTTSANNFIDFVKSVPAPRQVIIDSLWQQLDQIQDNLETILAEAKLEAKRYPEIALIDEIPGIGFVIAATIVAILENPHRFANKRKVWAYAGFGIDRKSSANKTYAEKLGKEYNRTLKCVVEEAAQAAINTETDNAFRRSYARLTIQKGIDPHHAILTVSRDIIATAWAMWKKGEHYNPEIDRPVKTDVGA